MRNPAIFLKSLVAGAALVVALNARSADVVAPAAAPLQAPIKVDAPSAPATPTTAAPSNQIWECTTNGLRTFSNNPCGTKSTVRQLNPINVMEPAPPYAVTHTYAPSARVAPASSYSYPTQDSSDATYTDNANYGYPVYVVVPRARRLRANEPHNHPRPPHRP
jgi:hypothetical protein